jgi:hypothetical protein
MNRIVILQPGYIPWLGFFEQLYSSDTFVFLDDVQFTKNDWRNRNRIKTKDGIQWLTIPVLHKFGQQIKETVIDNKTKWQKKHLQALKTWYGKSPFLKEYIFDLEKIYARSWTYLSDVDIEIILWINSVLGISRNIMKSSELSLQSDDRQLRLIEICKTLNGDHFYEGLSGKDYMDIEVFESHGITVEFQDYGHPYYKQLWQKEQGFISHLSIIDLLFNHGGDSLAILTGQKTIPVPEGLPTRHAHDV